MIEDGNLARLIESHRDDLRRLNINRVCTGDYYSVVELTDGSQGVSINYLNVHGPENRSHDYISYDKHLLELSKTDRLLFHTVLLNDDLDFVGKSVKIATLNALSDRLLNRERLRDIRLDLLDGYFDFRKVTQPGDTVGMIGCMGNYSCWQIGEMGFLNKIYFSDFEYTPPFEEAVETFVGDTFSSHVPIEISDGSCNKSICKNSDVLIISSETLCTSTFDELLDWPKHAREIVVVGWSYGMDPGPLFDAGATGLTIRKVIRPDLVGFTLRKLEKKETGYTEPFKQHFRVMHVVQAQ